MDGKSTSTLSNSKLTSRSYYDRTIRFRKNYGLESSLERVQYVESVSYVINPKAISKDTLYGTLDPTSREWMDGLFTHILRKIMDNVRGESSKRHWIIFDGDVDPK